ALVVKGSFWVVPVAIIAVREVAMSAYRGWVSRRGVSLPARRSAKVKTAVQDVAVGLALFPPLADRSPGVADTVLWAAVVLTVATGVQYLLDGRRTSVAL
ncbi:MAG TPA: CDP-alcohol phosphatidyltransferase family protein, partial [Acidimicrobiales bacterium]|nr:CDP-alcohol phosphatidyltransferase family protein [Acidimicrobiales bacterium]